MTGGGGNPGPAARSAAREGADAVREKVIDRRRDIHRHPELGDQEHRTATLVAWGGAMKGLRGEGTRRT